MPQPIPWKQLVADTIRHLGGEASLRDITASLESNPYRPKTPTWRATIRRVVRQYRIFEPLTTSEGLAGYKLVELSTSDTRSSTGKEDPHGEQQGMLLQLGSLCGYETFTNSTDRTIRRFRGEPISKLATVRNDADALSTLPLGKIRNTDVMWMMEDSEGLYPRYAFEVENSTKVRSGLLRLLRIPERFHTELYIIGPSDEESDLFASYMSESPFRQHAGRFHFFRYEAVKAFYESGLSFDQHRREWRIALE
ncbi:MAG: hypothetical protein ABSH14_10560 [Verrucomicrobiia bacterium]|jgi:hypothetical protein